MSLDPILISGLTDLARGRVAVRPEAMRFASCCLACASSATTPTDVRFTRTLILGVIGGIESTTLRVPLCANHRQSYQRRMRTISIVQWVCAFVATLAFVGLFATFETRPPSELAQQGLIAIGISAVVAAYVSIGMRATALPVKFSARQYDRWFAGGHGAYVFTFPDTSAAERFAEANWSCESSS